MVRNTQEAGPSAEEMGADDANTDKAGSESEDGEEETKSKGNRDSPFGQIKMDEDVPPKDIERLADKIRNL